MGPRLRSSLGLCLRKTLQVLPPPHPLCPSYPPQCLATTLFIKYQVQPYRQASWKTTFHREWNWDPKASALRHWARHVVSGCSSPLSGWWSYDTRQTSFTFNTQYPSFPPQARTIVQILFTLTKCVSTAAASRNITQHNNNQKQLIGLQKVAQLQPTTLNGCFLLQSHQ